MYMKDSAVGGGGYSGDYIERKKEERVAASLASASVYIIGPAKGTDLTLKATLTNVGFQNVKSYMRGEYSPSVAYAKDRMNVFFIKSMPDPKILEADYKLIRSIRTDRDLNRALSPIFVVTETPTYELTAEFGRAGVDGVLAIPARGALIRERLVAAVTNPPTFYRTVTYFGPDRRRSPLSGSKPHSGRGGPPSGPWSEIKIRRVPGEGCEIISETHGRVLLQKSA